MSDEAGGRTTNMTLDEQRAWVGERLDEAVAASGVADGWYDIYWNDVFWSAERLDDRELLLGSLFPGGCDGHAGRLDVSLKNTEAADPLAAAARVRTFWEAEGWEVTDVWSPPSAAEPHFRADGEDGALLGFQASEEGMSLSVHTACSLHNTVTNWRAYLDEPSESADGFTNEFTGELERREREDG